MKRFWNYLYECRTSMLWYISTIAIFLLVFTLNDLPLEIIGYPVLFSACIGLFAILSKCYRRERLYRELKMLEQSETIFTEDFPHPETITDELYEALAKKIETNYLKEREHWQFAKADMIDYYATWVHQVKAPIAVMRVLLQQSDTSENRELLGELFRIEQYVEMALTYVRLGEDSSDLVIQSCSLDEILRKAIRKYAGQFVRKKLQITYHGTSLSILTDSKWFSFIMEQLLSNAVKYTQTGGITISVNETLKQISITDTGIGIAPEDLPRIFEKGYTGYNGRLDKKSTGLGLYLCKATADRLCHTLTVQSTLNEGTTVTIDVSSYPLHAE